MSRESRSCPAQSPSFNGSPVHSYQRNGPEPSPGAMTICGYFDDSMNLPAQIRPPMAPTLTGLNFPSPRYLNQQLPASRSTTPSRSISAAAEPSAYLNAPP